MCAAALTIASGCSKDTESFDPEVSKTGFVELVASIENASTKASLLASNGEARWLQNDAISVLCTDGTSVFFDLNGTGDTRRAFFYGIIPDGKEMGDYACYPVGAYIENGKISYDLPTTLAVGSTGACSLMLAEIPEDDFNIEFKQLTAYLSIAITNLSSSTATVEITSDKKIGGKLSFDLATAIEDAEDAEAEYNSVYVDYTAGASSATVFFAVPAGEYTTLSVNAYASDGSLLSTYEVMSYSTIARGELKTFTISM